MADCFLPSIVSSPGPATPALLRQVVLAPSTVPSLSASALPSPCSTVSGHPNAAAVSMHCEIPCLSGINLTAAGFCFVESQVCEMRSVDCCYQYFSDSWHAAEPGFMRVLLCSCLCIPPAFHTPCMLRQPCRLCSSLIRPNTLSSGPLHFLGLPTRAQ